LIETSIINEAIVIIIICIESSIINIKTSIMSIKTSIINISININIRRTNNPTSRKTNTIIIIILNFLINRSNNLFITK